MRTLLNWLISYFVLAGTLFATSPVDITTGGGGAESSGAEGGSETVVEAETPGAEGGEESTEVESGEEVEGESTQEEKPSVKSDVKIDWRQVSPEVKAHLAELQKTNPKLANLVQNAVYTSQTFMREFPGGLKEAQALKKDIEELGGLEEAKGLREKYTALEEEQESLDAMARSGNPEVLNNLLEIATPEGFSKLMPSALGKWSASDPQAYNHVMSKVIVSAASEGGVVNDLNLAFRMLGLNNPEATKEAVEAMKRVAGWFNGINEIANKAPEKPKVDPEIERQTRELEDRKTKLFHEEFGKTFGSWRNRKIEDELARLAPSRQFNQEQKEAFANRVINGVRDILTADPNYTKALQKIYDTRSMPDLLRFTQTRTEKVLAGVCKSAFDRLFRGSNSKKPVKKNEQTQKETAGKGAPVARSTEGWIRVSADKAPQPDDIDNTKTDFRMKFNKQAILKNGKKVFWGDKVPK